MSFLRHRQRPVTSVTPHPSNRIYAVPARGVRDVILMDLEDGYTTWSEQSNFPSSIELVGATPNEGLRFTVLRDEPLVLFGVRSELQLPVVRPVSPERTYRVRIDVSFPTISTHRRTMFQYIDLDGELGNMLELQTRFDQVRCNWLQPGFDPPNSAPRDNYIFPDTLNLKTELILAPDKLIIDGQVIRNYGLTRSDVQIFKFGIYTAPYDEWPGGDNDDWSQHNSIRIDVIG